MRNFPDKIPFLPSSNNLEKMILSACRYIIINIEQCLDSTGEALILMTGVVRTKVQNEMENAKSNHLSKTFSLATIAENLTQ